MGPRFPVEREVPFGPQINARFYILHDQLQLKILAAIFTLGHSSHSDGSDQSREWSAVRQWAENKFPDKLSTKKLRFSQRFTNKR